jgi:hypothetical protein
MAEFRDRFTRLSGKIPQIRRPFFSLFSLDEQRKEKTKGNEEIKKKEGKKK